MTIISIDKLESAIADILQDYGDVVYKATEDGLTKAEKTLINNLKASSPKGVTKAYWKAWKGKGKRFKLKRYVGNTKTVKGRSGEIPLSNILEYSAKSPHQGLIKRTFESSVNELASVIIDEIKKEA